MNDGEYIRSSVYAFQRFLNCVHRGKEIRFPMPHGILQTGSQIIYNDRVCRIGWISRMCASDCYAFPRTILHQYNYQININSFENK